MLAVQVGAVREELAVERRLKEEAEQALDRDRRTLQLTSIASGAGTLSWHPKEQSCLPSCRSHEWQTLHRQLQDGQ